MYFNIVTSNQQFIKYINWFYYIFKPFNMDVFGLICQVMLPNRQLQQYRQYSCLVMNCEWHYTDIKCVKVPF